MQSASWAANWFAASREIPRISRNPKVHYRTHKRPPPVSIPGQPNPVHIPTSHLLEIHPNIIHPSTPRFTHWFPSLRFPHQVPIHSPLLTHTRHMPIPSHPISLLLLLVGVLTAELQAVDRYLLPSDQRIIADFVQSPFVVISSPKQYFCERCVFIERLSLYVDTQVAFHLLHPFLKLQFGHCRWSFFGLMYCRDSEGALEPFVNGRRPFQGCQFISVDITLCRSALISNIKIIIDGCKGSSMWIREVGLFVFYGEMGAFFWSSWSCVLSP